MAWTSTGSKRGALEASFAHRHASDRVAIHAAQDNIDVTLSGGDQIGQPSIILYDYGSGDAGLEAQFQNEAMFKELIRTAADRVGGSCGFRSSFSGGLRSYRNLFALLRLNRKTTLALLSCTGATGLPRDDQPNLSQLHLRIPVRCISHLKSTHSIQRRPVSVPHSGRSIVLLHFQSRV